MHSILHNTCLFIVGNGHKIMVFIHNGSTYQKTKKAGYGYIKFIS